ncbi:MAG: M28 family metallopeptidase [Candidatus Thorarchaeota archaeon]
MDKNIGRIYKTLGAVRKEWRARMSGLDDASLSDELGGRLRQFIAEICQEVGPRLGTSTAEAKAGLRIREEYKRYCDSTFLEEFSCHPAAFLDVVRVSVALYVVGVLLYLVWPLFTALLAALALVLFAAEMMSLREVVDPLFRKRTGVNVYGKIPPTGSPKQVVLISGHHDSAYEFPLHERLKRRFPSFIFLTIGLGVVTIVLGVSRFLILFLSPKLQIWFDWLFVIPIISSFPMLAFAFRLRSSSVVLGANDNLSGVAVTLGVGEWLKQKPLQHTEVWLVSFACEENMRGSKRFADLHREELQDAYVLNFDGVGAGTLYVLTAEPMYLTKLTSELCELVVEASKQAGLDIASGVPSFGGTDASNFIKAGLRATSVVGMGPEGFIANWHTLKDTPDMIDEKVLLDAVRLAVAFLEHLD